MIKKCISTYISFAKAQPKTLVLLTFGLGMMFYGFYRIYPFINVTPIGHVPGEGFVWVGMILFYFGLFERETNS
jgi:hypothetical protein